MKNADIVKASALLEVGSRERAGVAFEVLVASMGSNWRRREELGASLMVVSGSKLDACIGSNCARREELGSMLEANRVAALAEGSTKHSLVTQ